MYSGGTQEPTRVCTLGVHGYLPTRLCTLGVHGYLPTRVCTLGVPGYLPEYVFWGYPGAYPRMYSQGTRVPTRVWPNKQVWQPGTSGYMPYKTRLASCNCNCMTTSKILKHMQNACIFYERCACLAVRRNDGIDGEKAKHTDAVKGL